jgi:isochorismate synthase
MTMHDAAATRLRASSGSHRATELLDAYDRAGSFFLGSGSRTLLARGVRTIVDVGRAGGRSHDLPTRVRLALEEALRESQDSVGIVVGALPFDSEHPAHLVVPQHVSWAGPLEGHGGERETAPFEFNASSIPDPVNYMHGVDEAVSRIREGGLRKVVLARSLEMLSASPVDVEGLLRNLAWRNPGAYTFAVDIPTSRQNVFSLCKGGKPIERPLVRTFIGASPELLLSRRGLSVLANPLAGSVARVADPIEDWRRAGALLRSPKNRAEHAFVVEDVADRLRPFCTQLYVPAEPALMQTDTMWHLSTRIRGSLLDPQICSLTLAAELHPTPAVCGTPRGAALATIQDIEGFSRGFYAGLVGWRDSSGDGEWIVSIRCAEVEGPRIRLFAGAGIVEESLPAEELAETSAKFNTMLAALGNHTPLQLPG